MKIHKVTFILLVIGGLNWLLFGIFGKDLFAMLGFEMTSWFPVLIYILVGLSTIYEIIIHKSICKYCSARSQASNNSTPPRAGTGF